MKEIPTPSNLVEVRRYIDPDVGAINEYVPRNPAREVEYFGEATVQRSGEGAKFVTFKLPGPTLEDAIAGWAAALEAQLDAIERREFRAMLAVPAASMRRA